MFDFLSNSSPLVMLFSRFGILSRPVRWMQSALFVGDESLGFLGGISAVVLFGDALGLDMMVSILSEAHFWMPGSVGTEIMLLINLVLLFQL